MNAVKQSKRKQAARKTSRAGTGGARAAPSGRLAASAWTEAGLDLLAHGGVDTVRIDELARVLGVTKGSFYWHFEDRAHLLRSMLETWRRNATLAVIARLDTEGAPLQRLRRLIDMPTRGGSTQQGQSLELAVRLWARQDAHAAAVIEEIDQQRLTYVVAQLRASGVPEAKAGERAYLIYAFILAEALIPARAAAQVVSVSRLQRLADELVESGSSA